MEVGLALVRTNSHRRVRGAGQPNNDNYILSRRQGG